MRLRMAAASLAGLTLLAAGTVVTGPAVAGTTRAAGPATTVAAESGYIDTEPGGKVYDSQGGRRRSPRCPTASTWSSSLICLT
jgi:hypothetical protein